LAPATLCYMGTQFPPKGTQSPIFGPCLWWPNGCVDQDATWYGGGPQPGPRPHCVIWGASSLPQKGHSSPQFSAHVCCGQTAGWITMPLGMEVDLGPGHIVLHWEPPPSKKGTAPTSWPMSIVAKCLDGSRCHLVCR